MMRDKPPSGSINFGILRGDLPNQQEEIEAADPNSGVFARALHGNPIAKFFAHTAATIVGATVATMAARGLGRKGLRQLSMRAAWDQSQGLETGYVKALKTFRDAQKVFDEYGGVTSRIRHAGEPTVLKGGRRIQAFDDPTLDEVHSVRGFFFKEGDREKARLAGDTVPEMWTWREEMQQRMVKLARRLPYELPAAYVAQRFVSDPLLGTGPNKPVNWSNPVDVIGDFAQQSIKNLAFSFVPFEMGVGSAKLAYNKYLTSAANIGLHGGGQSASQQFMVGLDASLHRVGHQASDIISKTIRYGRQTTGSMAYAASYAASKNTGLVDTLHKMRKQGFSAWFNRVKSADESYSVFGMARDLRIGFRHKWRDLESRADEVFGLGGTRLGDYGAGLGSVSGRRHLPDDISSLTPKQLREAESEAFMRGGFFNTHAQTVYKRNFANALVDMGHDPDAANAFTNIVNFTLPQTSRSQTLINNRIHFRGKPVHRGSGTYAEAVAKRIRPRVGDQADAISANIERAMRTADAQYVGELPMLRLRLEEAFSQAQRGPIVEQVKRALGYRKQAYQDFGGNMTPSNAEFLLRRSAERAGIPLKDSKGALRSTSVLRGELRKRGFDPSDRFQMRAYLVTKGDISKPWNPAGLNFLGMRPLSVQEALDRNVFAADTAANREVKNLAQAIRRSDHDPDILNRLKVGGLYGASGRVVSTNPLRHSVSTALDTLATETKIPLIQLNPLSLFGWKTAADVRGGPAIRSISGAGSRPFVGGLGDDADELGGYLWFRGRRGRGRVTALNIGETGQVQSTNMSGTFKPLYDTPDTIAGRALRHAMGDTGRLPFRERSGFRSTFDVDDYQPNSLLAFFSRFRRRRDDINNVGAVAKMFRDDKLPADLAARADATHTLVQYWHNSSFTRQLIDNLNDVPSVRFLKGLFAENVYDMDAGQLHGRFKAIMGDEASLANMSRDRAQVVKHARNNLVKRWADLDDPSLLNAVLDKPKRTLGLHHRIDEARMDYMRYLAVEKSAVSSPGEFKRYIDDLISEVGTLQGAGRLTSREAAENRSALGSIYTTFVSMTKYDPSRLDDQDILLEIANALRGSKPGITVRQGMDQVLEDTINYGRVGHIRGRVRKHLGTGPYDFDGLEYNPSGASEVLVPTFATAFDRNPLKATLSAAGIKTYNNPENFSGGSIPVSHLFDRMNRAIGIFGLSVDPTGYQGPLDLFARGMIGKRALPLFAAGATFMAADRTLGGFVHNEEDAQGDRVYRPLFMGMAAEGLMHAQVGLAGLIPGGQTADEREQELRFGEVPIKSGRFWPLGNQPFLGGKTMYYRPSWYRRYRSAYQYTDQTFGSPAERLLFGYDFSPLRPLDPYRFEREHYEDRPYPASGDYFTGPWGPLTPVLNATVGRILKPTKMMHEEEVTAGLRQYQAVGDFGMAPPLPIMAAAPQLSGTQTGGTPPSTQQYLTAAAGPGPYPSGSGAVGGQLSKSNEYYINAAFGTGIYNTGSTVYPHSAVDFSNPYSVTNPRTPNNLVQEGPVGNFASLGNQGLDTAYRMQEFAGIYGFGFGAVREALGFGSMEFENAKPVLAQASQAYGASRQFWDLNLGGLGDFPTPLEGEYANLEFSEIVRRFIPKPRGANFVNPIQNQLGREHPWLPGADYFLNLKQGDPFAAIPEGEMRLPGQGYERLHDLNPDETGTYGRIDRFKILGDVAPYSDEFRRAARDLQQEGMFDTRSRTIYDQVMEQVADVQRKHEFTPFEHKYTSPLSPAAMWERVSHMDTYLHTKAGAPRTAVEDWERFNVYGSSFPSWSTPYESFIEPALDRARSRSPIPAALSLGFVGGMFGHTKRAQAVGRVAGAAVGFGLSVMRQAGEAITGSRYLPDDYEHGVAVEEYVDILKYLRASRNMELAESAGNADVANYFRRQLKSTMYGADLYEGTQEELAMAIPKRKREHFMSMINAPEQERERILSTSGRLERRIYQAAWGMKVERRPELTEYFQSHELPGPESEIWDPRTNMEHVEIKMLQQQGVSLSEMGFYPQQVQQANLVNPSYPDFGRGTTANIRGQLLQLMSAHGMSGDVQAFPSAFAGDRVELYSGV